MRFLIVITARGGSKRLKNKNIILLNKKPLIYWTIQHAKKISSRKKIVVSTDSRSILNLANKFGVSNKWLRPKKYSLDKSSSESAVRHAYITEKKNGFQADAVIILQPTSPFRNVKSIKNAIKIFKKKPNIPLMSVSEIKHPQKILALQNKKLSLLKNEKKIFLPNGSIFIINSKQVIKIKNYLKKKLNFIVFKGVKENLDIDTKQDYLLSKKLYKLNI